MANTRPYFLYLDGVTNIVFRDCRHWLVAQMIGEVRRWDGDEIWKFLNEGAPLRFRYEQSAFQVGEELENLGAVVEISYHPED